MGGKGKYSKGIRINNALVAEEARARTKAKYVKQLESAKLEEIKDRNIDADNAKQYLITQ